MTGGRSGRARGEQSGDGGDGDGAARHRRRARLAPVGRVRGPVLAGGDEPVRAVHAVIVVLVAAGARVARVPAAPALAAHAVRVRLRHVVPCNARVPARSLPTQSSARPRHVRPPRGSIVCMLPAKHRPGPVETFREG